MKKIIKTELLAPAKNKEVAFSAIDCGADAVYIGAPRFGAPRRYLSALVRGHGRYGCRYCGHSLFLPHLV